VLPSAKAPMDLFVQIRLFLTKEFIYQKYDCLSRFPGMSGQVFLQPALEIYAGTPFVFRDSGKVQEGGDCCLSNTCLHSLS
jgi:hypothetical protein